MRRHMLIALCSMGLFGGCSNLEDAELTKRNSFIRFYEGANSFVAAEGHQIEGGFILAGTIRAEGENPLSKIIVIKTDALGQKVSERIISGGIASSVKKLGSNYIVVGDSVEYNPTSGELANLVNTSSRIIVLDENLNVMADHSYHREVNVVVDGEPRTLFVDFHTTGFTQNNNGDLLITLGTFKRPGNHEKTIISAFNPITMDTAWVREYDYINRDYVNTRALYCNGGKIFWGASITETINAFSRSYVSIPVVLENSTFTNSSYFGQDGDQLFLTMHDLTPSMGGYAATGTYAASDGSKANMFLIQADEEGNILQHSIRYFDAVSGEESDPGSSTIQDSGEAIARTSDGGFIIAGTTTNLIYGGTDVWLVKTDVLGNQQWSKTLGGRSSESVSNIEVTADGGFLICGTLTDGSSDIGGLSSIFLIKTDSNGELKD